MTTTTSIALLTGLGWIGSIAGFSALFMELGIKHPAMVAAFLSVPVAVITGTLVTIAIGVNRKS